MGDVPHGACIAWYGGGWGREGGCGNVRAAGLCLAFRGAIYSQTFGLGFPFCALFKVYKGLRPT